MHNQKYYLKILGQNQGILSEIKGVKVLTFSTEFLGQHLISKYGIKPTQNQVKGIKEAPTLCKQARITIILGMLTYLRH